MAKKLKEKGFREKVNAYYGKHENIFDVHPALDMNDCGYRASAPTISQVLKWLREEKKLHIRASVYFIGWCVDVTNIDGKRMYSTECEYHNYEQAVITGIEYTLDNLI